MIRGELNSPSPAVALAVALVAFHALTNKQLRHVRLADIIDGHPHRYGRDIPLAAPVQTRLAAWLNNRNQTWPGSLNPYLMVSKRIAPRLVPVGISCPWNGITLRPQALREVRILHEIHATGGDMRRVCDMFGLSNACATPLLRNRRTPRLHHRRRTGSDLDAINENRRPPGSRESPQAPS